MRAQILAVVLIVAFAGLTGCIGANKETPGEVLNETNLPGGPTVTGGTAARIDVLQALDASISIDAPAWVASGTEVPVSLSAPLHANGSVSYTWAIGALPGTGEVTEVKPDTGSKPVSEHIQPGASKSLAYGTSGVYRMHCHPHPWMLHNVTVIEGFAGPKAVEVAFIDGTAKGDYRFVPENIVVGVGTVVTYKNYGAQPHTATAMGAQEPALTKLPLVADKGNVKIEGEGWQRLVAVFQDKDGRIGIAEKPIYTTATLPTFAKQEESFDFTHGSPSQVAGTPAEAGAKTAPVTLEHGGLVFVNYTFSDPLGATPAGTQAKVEVHFTKSGETQDTLTSPGDDAAGALSGKAQAGAYTIRVVPVQGAEISGTVTIEVVYELVPPSPTAPVASDGHGDHAGH